MILTLRALRTNYDLDANTVAEANGITYQTLLKYENDSSNIPVSLLKSLSKYYKVPMDNIFLGKKSELNRIDGNDQKGTRVNEILERIAKSLESIDAELKARNKDREILINQAEQIEKTCLEIKDDPFGLNVLKEKALADKAKQKE